MTNRPRMIIPVDANVDTAPRTAAYPAVPGYGAPRPALSFARGGPVLTPGGELAHASRVPASSPVVSIPKYPPKLRDFLRAADGRPEEAMRRIIESSCQIQHEVNAVEAWLSMLEWAIRLGADVVPGPLQPNLQCRIAPMDVTSGSATLAGTTNALGTQVYVDSESFLQAFVGGQFTTSAVYAPNPTRWSLYRGDRLLFFTEMDGSTSTIRGIGDEVFGDNLDHMATMASPEYFSRPDQITLDVRNEGATAYNHKALLVYAERSPVEDDYMAMRWDANPRFAVYRSGAFTNNAGPAVYTFRNPSRVFAIRGKAQPTAGSATTTAVRINLKTSRNFDITRGLTVDQLMFGVTNQRTMFLTNPIYVPAGGSILCSWSNDLPSSPGSLNHNVTLIYQQAKGG